MNSADQRTEAPEDRVTRYLREGQLNEQVIHDAISVRDYEFVLMALAALLRTSPQNIKIYIRDEGRQIEL